MKILEINIEGFGIFSDRKLKGLTPGLNVLYGPNEAGKTTLIEFIRRTLFGPPKRKKDANLYLPLNGGAHKGALKCQLASGEECVIHRDFTSSAVELLFPKTGESGNKADLETLLDHASAELFRNIYAFTLDELQTLKSLNEKEIQNRIYGAEMGLGAISLKQVEEDLRKEGDSLFLPRGKKREMNLLLEEARGLEKNIMAIQQNLDLFDQISSQLKEKESRQTRLREQLESLYLQRKNLEIKIDLYPTIQEFHEIQETLEDLPEYPGFPEGGLATLEKFLTEMGTLRNRMEEVEDSLQKSRIERDSLVVNQALLDHEADVDFLQQNIQAVLDARRDVVPVQEEKEQLESQIQRDLKHIGPDWDEERALHFEFSTPDSRRVDAFQKEFEELRDKALVEERLLKEHLEQKALERSKGWRFPAWLKMTAAGLWFLGLGGVGWGLYTEEIPYLASGAAVLIFALITTLQLLRNRRDFEEEDFREKFLKKNLEHAQNDLSRKTGEWRIWLREKHLGETLDPPGVKEIVQALETVRVRLSQRDSLEDRVHKMRKIEEHVQSMFRKLEPALGEITLHDDFRTRVNQIRNHFEEARDNREKRTRLATEIRAQEEKLENLTREFNHLKETFEGFLQNSGARDEQEFRRIQSIVEKRQNLQKELEQKRRVIESHVGTGPRFSEVLSVTSTPLGEISESLEGLKQEIANLESEQEHLHQEIGGIRNQIEQLKSRDDLLKKQGELEICKQRMESIARQWSSVQIALLLLDKAKEKYEKTRQPGVIRSAAGLFQEVTNGKYVNIIKPVDSDTITIESQSGKMKKTHELSRGTREQLYLSLRLGFIEEYEKRSESLPMIMDDVLVNFDDQRKRKMIDLLNKFAKPRQVLVFTCHQSVLDLCKRAGASHIQF